MNKLRFITIALLIINILLVVLNSYNHYRIQSLLACNNLIQIWTDNNGRIVGFNQSSKENEKENNKIIKDQMDKITTKGHIFVEWEVCGTAKFKWHSEEV